MSGLALGIDVGTSGIRAAALAGDGGVVASAGARMDEAGEDRRDPGVWERALALTLDRLAAELDLARIAAVSVDGTSGTVLGLDADGRPVGAALMYNDGVDDPGIARTIAAIAPPESARGLIGAGPCHHPAGSPDR